MTSGNLLIPKRPNLVSISPTARFKVLNIRNTTYNINTPANYVQIQI